MNNNLLDLKSIKQLLEENFFVAAYQRGYKWKAQQVKQLLNDINGFNLEQAGFYCLQPLVVKAVDKTNADGQNIKQWELIDGQQRLTTIFIILRFLQHNCFSIDYQTRHGSTDFLKELPTYKIQAHENWPSTVQRLSITNNIDNYHFFEAYKTINQWFEENPTAKTHFINNLLNHTKVIWYEIHDQNDSRDVFMRFNSGKIPLTNAELIKALFLKVPIQTNSENYRLRQNEIALEWDNIEAALHNDEFWSFINPLSRKNSIATRIELIFDLLVQKTGKHKEDPFYTFYQYQEWLSHTNLKEHLAKWNAVKECFLQLQEWFEDKQLYHLIGFLITQEVSTITELRKQKDLNKSDFVKALKTKIGQHFKKIDLDVIEYGSDNQKIIQTLILFNIDILLQEKSDNRFSFNQLKSQQWSLEHIHAQNSKKLDDKQTAQDWLHNAIETLDKFTTENSELLKQKLILQHSAAKTTLEDINISRHEFVNLFGEPDDTEENMHGLENMALLDKNTNSLLNNNLFASKRSLIIEKDKDGAFIPIATKNVFLKYYSPNTNSLNRWSKEDRENHLTAIKKAINNYIPKT